MKNKISLLLVSVLIGSLILVGCSKEKNLRSADFKEVKMAMTEKDLVKQLGKPSSKLTTEKEVEDLLAKDVQTMMAAMSSGNLTNIQAFVGDDQDQLFVELNKLPAEKASVYQYKYNRDKTKHIYLVDAKVIFMDFND